MILSRGNLMLRVSALALLLTLAAPLAFAQTTEQYATTVTNVEQRAQQGSAPDQYQLGVWYESGYPPGWPIARFLVPFNNTQAIAWLTKAAQQGFAPAESELGRLYYDEAGGGLILGSNANTFSPLYTQAMGWYMKAVAQGAAATSVYPVPPEFATTRWNIANENIGWMYLNGLGVEKNQPEAISWFNKVAPPTPGSAYDRIGYHYWSAYKAHLNKNNDAEILQQAHVWFQKAAGMGNQDAVNLLAQYFAPAQPDPLTQPAPQAAPDSQPAQSGTTQGTCSAVYITGEDEPPYGQHFFYGAGWNAATYNDALATANAELVKFAAGIDPRMLPGGQYGPQPEQGSGCTYAHGAVAGKLKISPPGSSMFNPSGAAGTAPMGPGIYDIIAAGFADSTDDAVAAAMAKCKSKNGPGDWEHEVCTVLTQW
jgi:TPR repeat protein